MAENVITFCFWRYYKLPPLLFNKTFATKYLLSREGDDIQHPVVMLALSITHFLSLLASSISSCSVAYTSTRFYFGYPPTQQHWVGAAPFAYWIQTIPLGRVTFRRLAQLVNLVTIDTPKNSLQLVYLLEHEPDCQVVSVIWVQMLARLNMAVEWPMSFGSQCYPGDQYLFPWQIP